MKIIQLLPQVCLVLVASACSPSASAIAEPVTVSAAAAPDKPWKDFPTRIVANLPDYVPQPSPALSTYGGLKDEPRAATGFFRSEKIGPRWWLIDPEGHRFINVGVVDVHIPAGSVAVNRNLREQFGTPAAWGAAVLEQLRSLGFNGTGGWSDDSVLRATAHPVVYTPIWNFMSEYGKIRGGTYQESGMLTRCDGTSFITFGVLPPSFFGCHKKRFNFY